MSIEKADVVRSIRGRDSGKLFYVIETDGRCAYIANGRDRRIEKAKKKKLKHIQYVATVDDRISGKLRDGERVTNAEIRRALAAIEEKHGEQGGMHIGEGRHD